MTLYNLNYGVGDGTLETTQVNTQVNTQENYADVALSDKLIKILEFCKTPRSMYEISKALGFKERKSVNKYLRPLLECGRITMTVPDNPNNRNQRYVTIN